MRPPRYTRRIIADQAAEPRAQEPQLAMMALELLGVGIAPRHHRRVLGNAQIGLPQPHPTLMALGCTVVSTVTRLRSWVRSASAACATRRLSTNRSSCLLP